MAAPGSPMIEIKNLVKHFGAMQAVNGVDLTVLAGKVVVIIGPSGSGKSTVLRCINHLETPTSGEIWVDGRRLTHNSKDINAVRAEVGMVFQQFNLFPHLTALENIMLAQRVVRRRNRAEAESVARAQLARVGIPE
jgi:polar amino acid transport system ATP-binding protein